MTIDNLKQQIGTVESRSLKVKKKTLAGINHPIIC